MDTSPHNRNLWQLSLVSNFSKAFERTTADFSWQEKADLIELLLQYIQLLQTSQEEATEFYTEKIMKRFRTKLQPAVKEKLFWYFDQELAFVELGIITTETFNALPPGEQGMTDEEYTHYLNLLIRAMKSLQYGHYVYASDEQDQANDSLDGLQNMTKGRPQRTPGDNLTKLNQEQTALLVTYLRKGSLIFKDEYLNDKTAGLAFALLTGFSPESLRQKISPKKNSSVVSKKNLEALHAALTNITVLINKDIKDLPKSSEGS